MAKRKKKPATKKKPTTTVNIEKAQRKQRKKLKGIVGAIIGVAVFIGLGSIGVNAYKKSWETSHDLSVIGNGTPTIVQIHDPNCPKCKKLMSNTKSALSKFDDKLVFRIADISTSAGRKLQRIHNANTVSLLMFDRSGKMRRTSSGVKSSEELELAFEDFLKRGSR